MNKYIGHILVVDDDDGIRNLVKKFLNENNFLVTLWMLRMQIRRYKLLNLI